MTARYAIYYLPPRRSRLEALGTDWLGRTPDDPHRKPPRPPLGFSVPEHASLTGAPKKYGFHATLKAPFELAPEVTEKDLLRETATICREHSPFALSGLAVSYFGNFLALTPTAVSPALHKLAADCVRRLDHLRAPLSRHDLERHMRKGLSGRQERLLRRFGYPFVLEEYRFHMTLTDAVETRLRPEYKNRLEALLHAYLADAVPVHEVTVCFQPDRSSPFTERARVALGSTQENAQ
ncbi:phosphonate metabolism protein [Oleidesulfovibrio alaskensis G20]|jgi:putative phosphonate metabolism protein|uniref:Phosphonate metabolism protein n=1 Tax=Oleidesulfovibrio alaskensis (strain ATCC BAA-1058 / DSM 17464 / G20) TaxID=207559 RepID=Q30W17_OLEA2|nr:DUF1045 domain-containing protein [Oleidesulfovibrio alaskensis]ABB40129.1 phosphonate metabolism protein [Oleidesulfovibrio alaskensis G20]MBG0773818.1 DUF1045 domain-containing protein [Oleidesulfovibrio alaskensis]